MSSPGHWLSHLRSALPLMALAATVACGTSEPDLAGPPAPRQTDGLPLAVAEIADAETFDALSFGQGEGLVIGRSVKFLIDNRNPEAPLLRFMNANFQGGGKNNLAAQKHFFFARAILPNFLESIATFNASTYFTNDKKYVAGTIQRYQLGDEDLYGVQFYPQDAISEATLLHVLDTLRPAFRIPGARVGFVATGPQQSSVTVEEEISALDFENHTIDTVLGTLNYIPMQLGTAVGILRIFPNDSDELSLEDIPVFDELPLDLTVVMATITRAFQDNSSHINLKSKERGSPNMVLRDADPNHELLREFDGKPVRLTVGAEGFQIEPATEEEVLAAVAAKLDGPFIPIPLVEERRVLSYSELCPGSPATCLGLADSFGGKAANLGFLRHPLVLGQVTAQFGKAAAQAEPFELSPAGVAVPLTFYQEFVAHNPALEEALELFIADEKDNRLTTAERVRRIGEIQALFYRSEFPPGVLDTIRAKIIATLPDAKSVKVRSSANAEDVPGFDGAGLYDSYRAKLKEPEPAGNACRQVIDEDDGDLKMEPKSLGCTIKGSYASLWNKRAVEERTVARLDHEDAAMGLAIVRRYKEHGTIVSNSVVVTRVVNGNGVSGYTFSTQRDNRTRTNPDPGTISENVIAVFSNEAGDKTQFVPTRFAKPAPDEPKLSTTLMSRPEMERLLGLIQHIERLYCASRPEYYPGNCEFALVDPDKPKALDLELKYYGENRFLIKQVREFSGR